MLLSMETKHFLELLGSVYVEEYNFKVTYNYTCDLE